MIKATWKHFKFYLSPYREKEVKFLLNRFEGALSSEFHDAPELIVKCCF
jgi:hypothetical protein